MSAPQTHYFGLSQTHYFGLGHGGFLPLSGVMMLIILIVAVITALAAWRLHRTAAG